MLSPLFYSHGWHANRVVRLTLERGSATMSIPRSKTHPEEIAGLSAVADCFEAIMCDVWGVLHNGVRAMVGAGEALATFRAAATVAGARPVVLVTNAPRPKREIYRQLNDLGVDPQAYDAIVTSGDVTRAAIAAWDGRPLFLIGPSRDLTLLEGLNARLVDDPAAAEGILCTGLFDDTIETPDDYRTLLRDLATRRLPMICANPDIVVDRNGRMIYCAGALARLYEDLGGIVSVYGKPHPPIYAAARQAIARVAGRKIDDSRILVIGDGLATDIRGAHAQGLPTLFITGGIHAVELGKPDAPDPERVAHRLAEEGIGADYRLVRLIW